MLALEPYAVKVARTVLRGECFREEVFLPDKKGELLNYIFKASSYPVNNFHKTHIATQQSSDHKSILVKVN